jgi:hypothetical protein
MMDVDGLPAVADISIGVIEWVEGGNINVPGSSSGDDDQDDSSGDPFGDGLDEVGDA